MEEMVALPWGRVNGGVVEPGDAVAMEADFLRAREGAADLRGALHGALSGVGLFGDLLRAGDAVVAAMEAAAADPGGEPRYHNRHHAAEATRAMGALCRVAVAAGLLSGRQAACGVVAMAGHDLHHDGSAVGGGVLEARSRAGVEQIVLAAGVGAVEAAVMGDIVQGTDPAEVAGNAARMAGGAVQDVLRCLANEADVCGSVMPRLGPRLGRLLAEEWAAASGPALLHVGTHAGRLSFLLGYPVFSGPARVFGLDAARRRSLAVYVEVGRALAGVATEEAGCAALDAMGDAGIAVYEAGLQGVMRVGAISLPS